MRTNTDDIADLDVGNILSDLDGFATIVDKPWKSVSTIENIYAK